MHDFKTLRILDSFQSLFLKFGINYPVMRKILQLKLTMDRRRVPTVFNDFGKKKEDDSNQFIKSLWVYGLIGLILIPFLFITDSYIFSISIFFGILMFILMTSMISDFSQVLLDIRDKNILSSKPVDKRTINAAKIVHISIYMFLLTFTITAIPLIVSLFARGILFFLLLLGQIILVDLLIVVATALLYLLILRFFDGEKLKDIINYVQILLSASIVIGYQVVIRSFGIVDLDIIFDPVWWHIVIPPIWYGALFELLFGGNMSEYFILFSVLACVLPFVSIFIYIKSIPAFERNLEKLTNQSSSKKKGFSPISRWLAKTVCATREERTFYQFARTMMKNERQFKLKVYPSFGFSIIFPFLIILTELGTRSLEEIGQGRTYFSIYLSTLMISTIILMLRYSEYAKGAWIYKAIPIKDTGAIYKGTLKAFMIHLYLPMFTIMSILLMLIFSTNIIWDIIVVWFSSSIHVIICFKMVNGGRMFFAERFEMAQQQDGWLIFASFLPLVGLFGIHFGLSFIDYGTIIYGGILIIINFILWKKVF
ncbi:hypothetical protein [Evansella tamaricis]|uniref:ABC transporter permease n=1 Tax=Evansella tamaricis TaxID=2069301 RepID=A0ABS6JJV3_9BACI|nr:hypothetical protein [Evansella tamaricis]MBU9713092.1 hypothetical protein [Evansella tamaricis]